MPVDVASLAVALVGLYASHFWLVATNTFEDLIDRLRTQVSHVRTLTVPGGGRRLLLSHCREIALHAIREMLRPDRGVVLASGPTIGPRSHSRLRFQRPHVLGRADPRSGTG